MLIYWQKSSLKTGNKLIKCDPTALTRHLSCEHYVHINIGT